MNAAFRRSEALERLENYGNVIVEHLALVTWFPENPAVPHWRNELEAWKNALRRYNKSKRNKDNYTIQLILDAIGPIIENDQDKDYLIIQVESHKLKVSENPDWNALKESFHVFAKEIVG